MSRQNYGMITLTTLEVERLRARIMTKIHEVDTVLFVGAGASVPFGYQTTDQFIKEIKNMPLTQPEAQIFNFYAETPDITIEDIIRALDIHIKVGSNPILRREAGSPLRTIELEGELAEAKNKLQIEEVTQKLENQLDAYKTLKDRIVSQLYIAYGDKPELEKAWEVYADYIGVLRERNDAIVPIFTTNYDKVIETLENIRDSEINHVIRGFKEQKDGVPKNPVWSPEEVLDQEPKRDRILLFKLHGSLNWRIDIRNIIREAEEGVFELRGFWKENVLIPPGTVDFQYGEPYQSLRTYFEGYLMQANTCVAIGYRFDDLTIRDVFLRSIERGLNLVMLNPEAEKIKADKFPQFENIVSIPKTIEEGVGDLRKVLIPSEAPSVTESEAEKTQSPAPGTA